MRGQGSSRLLTVVVVCCARMLLLDIVVDDPIYDEKVTGRQLSTGSPIPLRAVQLTPIPLVVDPSWKFGGRSCCGVSGYSDFHANLKKKCAGPGIIATPSCGVPYRFTETLLLYLVRIFVMSNLQQHQLMEPLSFWQYGFYRRPFPNKSVRVEANPESFVHISFSFPCFRHHCMVMACHLAAYKLF